jgi:hypothetical protein
MKQFTLTVAAGKRLIGKGMAAHPEIKKVLKGGTLVIIAGTTNGYVAEEILAAIGAGGNFSKKRFFRGITLPPGQPTNEQGRLPDEFKFPGDVVIKDGAWLSGKTLDDVLEDLKEGDIILKGANALDIERKRAAVLIAHPRGGTILDSLKVMMGRRVRLIVPVGLEKRITGDLDSLAVRLNAPGVKGLRLLPVPGEVFTEIDALALLTGVKAELFAGGGAGGAEGGIWLASSGTPENEEAAVQLLKSVEAEPMFTV